MSDVEYKKCINFEECHTYTNNKSGLCDYCLMDKYKIWEMRTYCCCDRINPLIREEDVLKIIDNFECKIK